MDFLGTNSPFVTLIFLSSQTLGFIIYLFLNMFIDFEIEEGREGMEEKGRETSIGCHPYASRLGIEPATWVCALSRNRTPNLLVCGTTLQPTEPHQPGPSLF